MGLKLAHLTAVFVVYNIIGSQGAGGAEPTVQGPRAPAVSMPAMVVPFSSYASGEAARITAEALAQPPENFGADIAKARAFYGKFNNDRLVEMRHDFAFEVNHASIANVPVDVVTPKDGVAPHNRFRVLINVHGGGFMWGSGSGALVEAAPIAALGRIKVITVDYRLAPEHVYPAATEDVAAVFTALLKSYRPQNIGIYGCSAGGILTAQTVAWLQSRHLPNPGAIATLCGSGLPFSGDSVFLDAPLRGQQPIPAATPDADLFALPYLKGVSLTDPIAFPGTSPQALAHFPPTLLIAGGRDFSQSSSTTMHRRLVTAGVQTESFIFEGMPHAFFVWPDLPESREAYGLITRFFDHHLGDGEPI